MTLGHIVEALLLGAGVLSAMLCCVGLVVMRDAHDRLHYLSAISTVPPVLIVAAVVVNQRLNSVGLKAIVVLAVSVVTGPILVHAIGRALRIKERGDARPRPEERVER
jgi:monovalent cation/proton antiporter MnhG/PhaG subunit